MRIPQAHRIILSAAALLTAPALFTSCETQTQNGALVGGLLGAGAGAVVAREPERGALIGGALGAATGAAIGSGRDRRDNEAYRDDGYGHHHDDYQRDRNHSSYSY